MLNYVGHHGFIMVCKSVATYSTEMHETNSYGKRIVRIVRGVIFEGKKFDKVLGRCFLDFATTRQLKYALMALGTVKSRTPPPTLFPVI